MDDQNLNPTIEESTVMVEGSPVSPPGEELTSENEIAEKISSQEPVCNAEVDESGSTEPVSNNNEGDCAESLDEKEEDATCDPLVTSPETCVPDQLKPESDTALTLSLIKNEIESLASSSAKSASEMRDLHRLYHNEFAGRLKNMQDELDRYHELDRGRVFDDVLRAVAQIYCDHESLKTSIDDEKTRKRLEYLFLDMLQLLEGYGVHLHQSHLGDKRDVRFCQVIERTETSDPSLHDTVARSKSPGFYTEKRPLIKEMIDVYVYKKPDEASQE